MPGQVQSDLTHVVQCKFVKNSDIDKQLTRFWELEEFSNTKPLSPEEKTCENHFVETVKRDTDGHFIVKIPLKESVEKLGESYDSAKNRFLSLERKFARNEDFKSKYFNFINEYRELGHMSKVDEHGKAKHTYHMPHHGVINLNSSSTKLRVAFDASYPTSSGISFNDLQLPFNQSYLRISYVIENTIT